MRKINLKIETILLISCFFCIISQLPDLWGNSVISLIYNCGWLLLLDYFIIKDSFKVRLPLILVVIPIAFDLLVVLFQIISRKPYLNSNMFMPLHLCTFISIIGCYIGKYCNKNIIVKIIKIFLLGTFILSISIFRTTFSGVNWQDASGYLYTAKNSAATIFLLAIIMGILYIRDLKKIFVIPLLCFLSLLILMMKSRATILCLVLIIIYLVIFYVKNPVFKILLLFLLASFFFFVLFNKNAYNLFINKIIFNNRSTTDLTVITSGRDEHFEYFIKQFPNYILSGTGGTYLESFPLAALMSYGFFGGILIIIYTFLPSYYVLKNRKKISDKRFKYLILSLNIVLVINGLFEELTPLGPGVKCFILWLFFGCCVGLLNRKKVGDLSE